MSKNLSSPDYPKLGQKMLQGSGDAPISKLVPGLYVVATPIGHLGDITLRALVTLTAADCVACEDTRVTGGLMHAFGIHGKDMISFHDHNEQGRVPMLVERIKAGGSVALTSDAGLPLIADPGFRLVQACREEGLPVTVIPGANAALTALAGSGLATDRFYFAGFLTARPTARAKEIEALKTITSTIILYESPQRLVSVLREASTILGTTRQAVVARELTKLYEESRRGTLAELATHYTNHPPKGEIVILIAPGQAAEAAIAAVDIDDLLLTALKEQSMRDAVEAVTAATSRKRSEIYARALWLAKRR